MVLGVVRVGERGVEIDRLMLKSKRLMKRKVYTIPGTEWRVLDVEIGGNLTMVSDVAMTTTIKKRMVGR